jgi:DNA-binding MurR/RpiR family transcriptional regulator
MQQVAHELGIDQATLTRLSMRTGLRVIRRKLSQVEPAE